MVAFLKQEYIRYNQLLQTVHNSLDDLYAAVKGEIVMSETLEDTYTTLLHNRVPLEWKVSYVYSYYLFVCFQFVLSGHVRISSY